MKSKSSGYILQVILLSLFKNFFGIIYSVVWIYVFPITNTRLNGPKFTQFCTDLAIFSRKLWASQLLKPITSVYKKYIWLGQKIRSLTFLY